MKIYLVLAGLVLVTGMGMLSAGCVANQCDCVEEMADVRAEYGAPEETNQYDSDNYHSETWWYWTKGIKYTFTWGDIVENCCDVSVDNFEPMSVNLIQPADQTVLLEKTPFIWNLSCQPDSVQYQFEIDSDVDFSKPQVEESLYDTFYTLPPESYEMFVPLATYYWHVRANAGGDWVVSEIRSFTVTSSP